MSLAEPADTPEVFSPDAPFAARMAQRWARVEAWLVQAGDRLNPILVKEARQALKSRQFAITFALLLGAGWVWSLGGLALIGPSAGYSASGPEMFFGYYIILSFPLLVIVPYGAFLSLAGERADRTYELLSITTLGPRQIISGKLASAMLQMLVYMSAILPCLAFTYLLRGIDIPTIVLMLCYLVAASAMFSLVGILLATIASDKWQQQLMSVILVLGFGYAFFGGCVGAYQLLDQSGWYMETTFWSLHLAGVTAYASYAVVFYLAAAAQLNFAGSNRSTALRAALLGQQVLFAMWSAWICLVFPPVWYFFVTASVLHWYVIGTFLTGESPQLSARVRRDLPHSFAGRLLGTWFNPGPGTGYIFTLTSLFGMLLLANLALRATQLNPLKSAFGVSADHVLLFSTVAMSYVAIYLGIGKLLLDFARRFATITGPARVITQVVLVIAGTATPLVIQFSTPWLRNSNYTLLQISNPFWTLTEAIDRSASPALESVRIFLAIVAVLVFCANLPAVMRELRQPPVAKPARVVDEDQELAAAAAPPALPVHKSPWD